MLNDRVFSLIVLNGLGLVALSLSWKSAPEVVPILSLFGAAGSAVMLAPIAAADAGIANLLRLWKKHAGDDNLPIVGLPSSFVWRIVWIAIPVLFIVVWARLMLAADGEVFGVDMVTGLGTASHRFE
ncbi:MAG: hypothetical protein AAGB00_05935 [Planctomycetota bacterium]